MRSRTFAALSLVVCSTAFADTPLQILSVKVDRPTVISLGVQVLISGDEGFDASIGVRYRPVGTTDWKVGLPLFRVHPERVVGRTVPSQFAGSIFELKPGTSWELELHVVDADNGIDTTQTITAATRPVPRAEPMAPNAVSVTDAASLSAALGAAKAGDVITLANGTYSGQFSVSASGTEDNPIVIRGATADGVILDGGGCTGCNELEVYGSYVHIERLTIRHVERAVRWQSAGAVGNVLRHVTVKDVRLGVGGKDDQRDFYICDNVLEGRLGWPLTYGSDGAAHASDDGIVISGEGHVVCHNRLSGFADSLQSFQSGTRSNDFYGNDSIWNYDDGIELDGMEGNARCFDNRFTNTYDALSFQPIYGGPAYAFRNVVVNVDNEGMKLHALGAVPPQNPDGILLLHNTFVRPKNAIRLSTPNPVHDYVLENNLFLGAESAPTVMWDTPIDYVTATIDFNGYSPDGSFEFGYGPTGATYPDFAAVVAGGRYETNGVLLKGATFANGLTAPSEITPLLPPADVRLAAGSNAVDRGTVLANLDDGFRGEAPDLGAIELGCPLPSYGPRPEGIDESNEPARCPAAGVEPGDGGAPGTDGGLDAGATADAGLASDGGLAGQDGGAGGDPGAVVSSCGCNSAEGSFAALVLLFVAGAAAASLPLAGARRR